MSQQQRSSDRSSVTDGPDSPPKDSTSEQLAEQARAAAEQAIQLARLAQESAELARKLNAQVLQESGHSAPEPVPSAEPLLRAATEPWEAKLRRRKRRPQDRPEQRELSAKLVDMPQRIRIHVSPRDRGALRSRARRWFFGGWRSVFVSSGVHLMVLAVLGYLTFSIPSEEMISTIIASFAEEDDTVAEAMPIEEPVEKEGDQQQEPTPQEQPDPEEPDEPPPAPMPEQTRERTPDESPTPDEAPVPEADAPNPAEDGEQVMRFAKLNSRTGEGKALLLEKYGGNAASESAVGNALDWLARMQRRNGSWNFNDVGPCSGAGSVDNPMGATSYVLLTFLGAGQTHREGTYQQSVQRGLNFLLQYGRAVPAGGDFRGPNCEEHHNFYVQGAAAMALAEAYAMTGDRRLRTAAQSAVNFIVNAQDPVSGGWRYEPRSTGCTSVTALQLTAVMSAKRAGLKVSERTLDGIRHFLDSVMCEEGPTGRYCYREAQPSFKSASTAQAILCRMYLGTGRDDEDVQNGVAILDERGPYDNRYYCYYATQVMKNWSGVEWERWNQSMRDELIRTQAAEEGPAQGSWAAWDRSPTSVGGGRLFATCLCAMTLEVYYRYPPLDGLLQEDETVAEAAPP